MRPQGEIRTAICNTLRVEGAMALVEIVARLPLQTTPTAIKNTVDNCVRAGVLQIVGHDKRPHCHKWVALYDLADENDGVAVGHGFAVLGDALKTWR